MEDFLTKVGQDLATRVSGPMSLRLVLQPLMAAFFAVRSGLRDARSGQPAFFWSILTNPAERRRLLRDGWKDVGKVFVMATVIDLVYQYIVTRGLRLGEALLMAFVLAILPYLLLRGPVSRIARR
jgi:hypothetical protein